LFFAYLYILFANICILLTLTILIENLYYFCDPNRSDERYN